MAACSPDRYCHPFRKVRGLDRQPTPRPPARRRSLRVLDERRTLERGERTPNRMAFQPRQMPVHDAELSTAARPAEFAASVAWPWRATHVHDTKAELNRQDRGGCRDGILPRPRFQQEHHVSATVRDVNRLRRATVRTAWVIGSTAHHPVRPTLATGSWRY